MKRILFYCFTALTLAACSKRSDSTITNATTASEIQENNENVTDGPTKGKEIGNLYIDITLPGPQGNPVKFSDYVSKNKYTLIDFWASWCGPCRAEMHNVVQAYTEFHDKGLEIIGVSLDKDHDAWMQGISELEMPWPQMSDLNGWECAGAVTYNIRSIPANVLIDQQGIIVAKDLRGVELLDKMAELMNTTKEQ